MDNETRVRAFFDAYARRFNDALAGKAVDTRGVTDAFADYFVEASPAGVRGGRNGLLFRLRIPFGFRHYRKLGTKAMRILKIEVTALDDLHLTARVHWDSRYVRKDGSPVHIEFDNLYFVQMQHGEPRIFAYVTGDEALLLKQHGLA